MAWVIAMKGAPGSGKSTLARALGAAQGWPVIDKDDIKDHLDGLLPDPTAGGAAYDIMLRLVRRQLGLGVTVIADSPLLARTYDNLRAVAAETGAGLAVIDCVCADAAVWRERITSRQALGLPAHHTTTWDGVTAFQTRSAGNRYPITDPVLELDTAGPLPACLAQVSGWLEAGGVLAR